MFRYIRRLNEKLHWRIDDWCRSRGFYNPIPWILKIILICGVLGFCISWALFGIAQITGSIIGDIVLIALGVAVVGFCASAIYGALAFKMARKRLENILKDTPEQLQRNKERANCLVDLQTTLTVLGNDVAKAIVLLKASKSTNPDKRLGEVRAILSRAHDIIVSDAVLRDAQLHRAREAFEAETEVKVASA